MSGQIKKYEHVGGFEGVVGVSTIPRISRKGFPRAYLKCLPPSNYLPSSSLLGLWSLPRSSSSVRYSIYGADTHLGPKSRCLAIACPPRLAYTCLRCSCIFDNGPLSACSPTMFSSHLFPGLTRHARMYARVRGE